MRHCNAKIDLPTRSCLNRFLHRSDRAIASHRYQFCFRAILEAVDKALVKAVRAVGSKKDEISGLQFDIGDLEDDIGNALDEYAGEELGDELLGLGGRVSSGQKVDVRWTAFDADRDKAAASNVTPAVRKQSLEAAGNAWSLRGNAPVGADAHGYASRSVTTLGQRVEALAISAGPDAWRQRYAEVCGLGNDVTSVHTCGFTPPARHRWSIGAFSRARVSSLLGACGCRLPIDAT